MKNKQAFTLIELLVVVLIIGILAAVAVPQYQKAVEKSRATQALTMLKSVVQAAEAYYMANGTEFSSFDELALDIPWPKASRVIGGSQDTRSNGQWALEIEDSSTSGATVLFMTQLQGKYKGAGFYIGLNNKNGHSGEMKIMCHERKNSSTKTFDTSLAKGAFCGQIMQGTLSSENTWGCYYTLP